MKVMPYIKPTTKPTNVYNDDYSKPLAKFNIKTLSDDESDFGRKPPSYSRSMARKIDNDSDSSDTNNRPSARSAQVRRNTKTLQNSATDLRASSKSAGRIFIHFFVIKYLK
jgi:hypothetical protein